MEDSAKTINQHGYMGDSRKIDVDDDPLKVVEIFGVAKTRRMYEDAIAEAGITDDRAKALCLKFAALEKSLDDSDRARAIYIYASSLFNLETDPDFWTQWLDFEQHFGNEDTIREMLRIKRSVSSLYQPNVNLSPELFFGE
ncbi:pre-mRNA-splicing factor SYF1-like [Chenopodium quinoa]|uniref:pre-mRNA-splicing factor SYF1-like n=1 Tax=Chenopodium quinoa TaxID=63459 RepID=UPI000B783F43|nr:pre-mRNA-splicing factor SYF1-like [Chenopodium quinoa]